MTGFESPRKFQKAETPHKPSGPRDSSLCWFLSGGFPCLKPAVEVLDGYNGIHRIIFPVCCEHRQEVVDAMSSGSIISPSTEVEYQREAIPRRGSLGRVGGVVDKILAKATPADEEIPYEG